MEPLQELQVFLRSLRADLARTNTIRKDMGILVKESGNPEAMAEKLQVWKSIQRRMARLFHIDFAILAKSLWSCTWYADLYINISCCKSLNRRTNKKVNGTSRQGSTRVQGIEVISLIRQGLQPVSTRFASFSLRLCQVHCIAYKNVSVTCLYKINHLQLRSVLLEISKSPFCETRCSRVNFD